MSSAFIYHKCNTRTPWQKRHRWLTREESSLKIRNFPQIYFGSFIHFVISRFFSTTTIIPKRKKWKLKTEKFVKSRVVDKHKKVRLRANFWNNRNKERATMMIKHFLALCLTFSVTGFGIFGCAAVWGRFLLLVDGISLFHGFSFDNGFSRFSFHWLFLGQREAFLAIAIRID